MKLYHGSSKKFDGIRKSQAQKGEGLDVPEQELLNGIYLTPNYSFALAIGAMPEGAANINDETKEIEFEHPENFTPDKPVYIYEIDTNNISQELLKQVDEKQWVITGIDELKPNAVKETTAREVLDYYRIKNLELRENNELKGRLR